MDNLNSNYILTTDSDSMSKQTPHGFKAVPLKFMPNSLISHTIFLKEHSVRGRSEDKPEGRTLFVLNVPPFVNEESLRNVFSEAGKIDHVEFSDKPSSSDKITHEEKSSFSLNPNVCIKVAYIVYSKAAELNKALQLTKLKPLTKDSEHPTNGVMKWIKEYNTSIPNVKNLKDEINSYMSNFDKQTKDKKDNEKHLAEADDEGWITVTKHSRKPGFERKESVGNRIILKEKARQQKKELKNFYTFQIRESKMKHVIALRQKFEEDKKKIALLKESRRFRPF